MISTLVSGSQLKPFRFQLKPDPLKNTCRSHFGPRFMALYKTDSFYDVLGIAESVTVSDIKKAYKEMARKYHPDVSPADCVNEYTQRFILVKEAYETLSDPQTRASYDQDLALGLKRGGNLQRSEERFGEWKMRWQSQLNELERRRRDCEGRMSWGARMRCQRRKNAE